jgi:ATP-dependent DNA helicase RecQ
MLREVTSQQVDLLYLAPEQTQSKDFGVIIDRCTTGNIQISMMVVDEGHCISLWGPDFRPDYFRLPVIYRKISSSCHEHGRLSPKLLVLTATATNQQVADMKTAFGIRTSPELEPPSGVHRLPMARSNLHFAHRLFTGQICNILSPNKIETNPCGCCRDCAFLKDIEDFYKGRSPGFQSGPAIVYLSTKKKTIRLMQVLRERGIQACAYNGSMKQSARDAVQRAFMKSPKMVMCATVAFGMGVDKRNVRAVFHLSIPKSLEAYWQEVEEKATTFDFDSSSYYLGNIFFEFLFINQCRCAIVSLR